MLFLSNYHSLQINNRSLHLGQNRRRELRDDFGSHCADILSLLAACLSSHPGNTEIMTRVMLCYHFFQQLLLLFMTVRFMLVWEVGFN